MGCLIIRQCVNYIHIKQSANSNWNKTERCSKWKHCWGIFKPCVLPKFCRGPQALQKNRQSDRCSFRFLKSCERSCHVNLVTQKPFCNFNASDRQGYTISAKVCLAVSQCCGNLTFFSREVGFVFFCFSTYSLKYPTYWKYEYLCMQNYMITANICSDAPRNLRRAWNNSPECCYFFLTPVK